MNQDEVIAMAKEAGFGMQMALLDHPYCQADAQRLYQQLERFAALVAAKEREAIQVLIEQLDEPPYRGYENPNTWDDALIALSALIRARGQKEGT